jgi:hypothetical protein
MAGAARLAVPWSKVCARWSRSDLIWDFLSWYAPFASWKIDSSCLPCRKKNDVRQRSLFGDEKVVSRNGGWLFAMRALHCRVVVRTVLIILPELLMMVTVCSSAAILKAIAEAGEYRPTGSPRQVYKCENARLSRSKERGMRRAGEHSLNVSPVASKETVKGGWERGPLKVLALFFRGWCSVADGSPRP